MGAMVRYRFGSIPVFLWSGGVRFPSDPNMTRWPNGKAPEKAHLDF